MNFKVLQRMVLGATLIGSATAALPQQISLPGLDVRITHGRPPALRREIRPARPGDGYLWVSGSWDWDGGHWRWIPGRWDRPAVANGYWIPARYVRTSRGTIYEPGHWSNQQVIVTDDIRKNRDWRRHERLHERELERERDRNNYRDRDRN